MTPSCQFAGLDHNPPPAALVQVPEAASVIGAANIATNSPKPNHVIERIMVHSFCNDAHACGIGQVAPIYPPTIEGRSLDFNVQVYRRMPRSFGPTTCHLTMNEKSRRSSCVRAGPPRESLPALAVQVFVDIGPTGCELVDRFVQQINVV
jgi:hypothetical protein